MILIKELINGYSMNMVVLKTKRLNLHALRLKLLPILMMKEQCYWGIPTKHFPQCVSTGMNKRILRVYRLQKFVIYIVKILLPKTLVNQIYCTT